MSGENKNGTISVEVFQTILKDMSVPLSGDQWTKLLKVYDKKNEGSLNWEDLLTDHKYVHAVRRCCCCDVLKINVYFLIAI